jgi:hypothetical protein
LLALLPFIFQLPTTSGRRLPARCDAGARSPRQHQLADVLVRLHELVRLRPLGGGKTWWITGLTAPDSSQGHAVLRSDAAICALNATGRGRSVEPVIVSGAAARGWRRRSTARRPAPR